MKRCTRRLSGEGTVATNTPEAKRQIVALPHSQRTRPPRPARANAPSSVPSEWSVRSTPGCRRPLRHANGPEPIVCVPRRPNPWQPEGCVTNRARPAPGAAPIGRGGRVWEVAGSDFGIGTCLHQTALWKKHTEIAGTVVEIAHRVCSNCDYPYGTPHNGDRVSLCLCC